MIISDIKDIDADNKDCDYFGFPENIFTFGHSKNANLLMLEVGKSKWYLRKEKTQAILIYLDGEVDKEIYESGIQQLKRLGIQRFGSLASFKRLPAEEIVKTWTWMSYRNWENTDIQSRTKQRIRNSLRKFDFELVPKTKEGIVEATKVLDNWYKVAQTRHFMVVYGHYAMVIKYHATLKNSFILKMTPKGGKDPCGIIGGYTNGDQAVLVLSKHDFTQKCAGDALWGKWFSYVHDDLGIKRCNNGDTADSIKSKFGLERKPVYRIKRVSLKTTRSIL